jgi:hypothetical protein
VNPFIERLSELNPQALSADGFDDAIIGIAQRHGSEPLLAYSIPKCIKVLVERDGMSEEDAQEFFDFNVLGAWVGDGTPIYIDDSAS